MFQDWRNCYCDPPGCQYVNFDQEEVVPDCESLAPVAHRQNPVRDPGHLGPPLPVAPWNQRCIDDAAVR
jgi:hypothetical protein